MKKRGIVFCILIPALLAGCSQKMSQQQEALLHELADRPVTCTGKEDCRYKWNKAIVWVREHSSRDIKTLNDNMIQTYTVDLGHHDNYPIFTIIKYWQVEDTYIIDYHSVCDQKLECETPGIKLKISFKTALMGLPPGVRQIGPDTYQKKTEQ